MNGAASKNYALALFDLSLETNQMDVYKIQLFEILKQLGENVELQAVMSHPKIRKDDKKALIKQIFKCDEMINNFIQLLIDKNRFDCFEQICIEFNLLVNKKLNIEIAYISSASELDAKSVKEIVAFLEKRFNKKIQPKISVDPSHIAGIKIRIQDEILDNTIARKLSDLKQSLLKSSI